MEMGKGYRCLPAVRPDRNFAFSAAEHVGGRCCRRADAAPRRSRRRRVGLFGGSFDPPHAGHLHVARLALRRLRLQDIWWLVTARNPLKAAPVLSLEGRVAACRRLVLCEKRMRVMDIEARVGSGRTVAVLRWVLRRADRRCFVWIMGADSFQGMHRWHRWQDMFNLAPVAVVSRAGVGSRAGLSPAARRFAAWRRPARAAAGLATARPPRWCVLGGPTVDESSTRLRGTGK